MNGKKRTQDSAGEPERRTGAGGVPRRVLVALDAATLCAGAFDLAAEFARLFDADLSGLFIEDMDLLHSAALPFVRQFGFGGASGSSFDLKTIERELDLLATKARNTLVTAAERRKLRHSFRVVRGQLASQLAESSTEADLVVLQASSRPLGRHLRLEAPGLAAATALGCAVLLLEPGMGLPSSVLVALEDGEVDERALAFAAEIARLAGLELRVLAPPLEPREAAKREAFLRKRLAEAHVAWRLEVLPAFAARAVAVYTRQHGQNLLVLSAKSPLLAEVGRDRLIATFGCPLLLIR
ncbi:MAG TPA: universal stress protein [Alphaproteobacteria bacterium]|nr:universal stress protein [Alphaproteobacteria bacterium]